MTICKDAADGMVIVEAGAGMAAWDSAVAVKAVVSGGRTFITAPNNASK